MVRSGQRVTLETEQQIIEKRHSSQDEKNRNVGTDTHKWSNKHETSETSEVNEMQVML